MRLGPQKRIVFPWEGRGGGLRRFLRLGRLKPFLGVLGVLGILVAIGVHERRDAGVRQTRATLLGVRRAVDSYIADHDGGCPTTLAAVAETTRGDGVPRDAWGRPLRLVCPGRFEGAPFELMSDGPDGEPGGLDRIE
ncbi:MAG TPA: type II secretion system protein GspG [Polyangiaceae bacterium]